MCVASCVAQLVEAKSAGTSAYDPPSQRLLYVLDTAVFAPTQSATQSANVLGTTLSATLAHDESKACVPAPVHVSFQCVGTVTGVAVKSAGPSASPNGPEAPEDGVAECGLRRVAYTVKSGVFTLQ